MDISNFLAQCASTAYPEPESELHTQISQLAFKYFFESQIDGKNLSLGLTPKVLDVGCGSGFMAAPFREKGWWWRGLSLDREAVDSFNKYQPLELYGPSMEICDMHDLGGGRWLDDFYDLIWARHVLEHSPIPFKVLMDFHRMTRPGRFVYLEMPAPNTQSMHAMNPNHYSVFEANGWIGLIAKAGFEILYDQTYNITIKPEGRQHYIDQYYAFLLRRPFQN